MLPYIKHLPVNWMDGMKISKEHFIQLEDAVGDLIRDAAGVHLTNYNYGLLPPGPNAKQSLNVQIYFDRSEQVTIKVLECRAITPGGARIEITHNAEAIETNFQLEKLKSQPYEINLVVDPFTRVPVGQPNPSESPLRQPYTLPRYHLEVLPYPQTHQPEYGAFQLCVGQLRMEGEAVRLSEQYIPPCTSLISHPRLAAAHQKLLGQLGEAEVAVTEIMQRARAKTNPTPLDANLLYLMGKMADYLADSVDTFRLMLLQQPPLHVVTFYARFARSMNIALNSLIRKQREELLDYFNEWFEMTPREMENLLRTLLTISYEHNDIYAALNKVEVFSDRVTRLLKKMSDLYIVKREDAPTEKVYGWLVLHTENRKRLIYKLLNKTTIIGRADNNTADVDFDIQDDQWISRRHARLSVVEERGGVQFQLNDLNSNNGTYIHDTKTRLKPNQEFTLMDGDTFQVGKTNILFRSADKADSERSLLSQIDAAKYFKVVDIKDLVTG